MPASYLVQYWQWFLAVVPQSAQAIWLFDSVPFFDLPNSKPVVSMQLTAFGLMHGDDGDDGDDGVDCGDDDADDGVAVEKGDEADDGDEAEDDERDDERAEDDEERAEDDDERAEDDDTVDTRDAKDSDRGRELSCGSCWSCSCSP